MKLVRRLTARVEGSTGAARGVERRQKAYREAAG